MRQPLVSVIVPTYNRAHLIGETLDSVLAQTFTNWECIIVDDGSSDDTDELINKYTKVDLRFKYFIRPVSKPKGPCSCRNFGFKKAKGNYILFFDSDDYLKSDALQNLLATPIEVYDAIIAKTELVVRNTREVRKTYPIYSDYLLQDFFVGNLNFFVCGPLWKRDFLTKQKKLFNEKIRNGDDWDFNLRMLYQNPRLKFLEYTSSQHLTHGNSLSKERLKLNFSEIIPYLENIDYHASLIVKFEDVDKNLIYKFLIEKYRTFLISSLLQKNKSKKKLLKRLLILEFYHLNYTYSLKSLFGYFTYIILGKGYKLIIKK